ncbi:hypothetical protein [Mucilaginibacter sp.]|uniref:hypothetical protein n=1 Tax=Mucilaginibacter sp. TaxID=1882438 RepID=UPI003D11A825
MLIIQPIIAQVKPPIVQKPVHAPQSVQLATFFRLAAQANVKFNYPKGFREIKAVNDEDFSFDYALDLPGKDFEIWFQVKSEKENWTSYEHSQNTPNSQLANPDSLYASTGAAQASALTGDTKYYVRNIPPSVLKRYNADAGKSFLLTLLDMPATKHYKYALLITLQKNHTGRILAVCFTNEKGPEFYKNIDRASNCLKFKTSPQ